MFRRYDTSVSTAFIRPDGNVILTTSNNLPAAVELPLFRNVMELSSAFNYPTIEKSNHMIGEQPIPGLCWAVLLVGKRRQVSSFAFFSQKL